MDAREFLPDEKFIAAIKQDIARYEQERVSARRQAAWRVPVYLVLVLAMVYGLAVAFNRIADANEQWTSAPHVFLYVAAVALAFFLYSRAMKPVAVLRQSFRARLLPIIFGFIENLRYSHGSRPGFVRTAAAGGRRQLRSGEFRRCDRRQVRRLRLRTL